MREYALSAEADLAKLLHQLAALLGDDAPLHVVIERGGRRVELTARPAAAPPGRGLNDGDLTVLQAVAELGGRPTTGQIADRSGYGNDAHLRMRLSRLRTLGLLGGARGETGYQLTEAGLDALKATEHGPP